MHFVDIRFALMALTPDPRSATLERLNMLRTNRTIVVHALNRIVSNYSSDGDPNDSSSDEAACAQEKIEVTKEVVVVIP